MKISQLHYISQELNGKSHAQNIREACDAGVDWVQLRIKDKSIDEVREIAFEVKEVCEEFNVTYLINDYVEIAKEIDTDGVHLGKTDMDIYAARLVLGEDKIIGATANSFEDVLAIAKIGVDYIGLGPYRFTDTKANLNPILGLEGFQFIMKKCKAENIHIPIIAIGGIIPEDVSGLLSNGINGVAVSSMINKALNKKEMVSLFANSFHKN